MYRPTPSVLVVSLTGPLTFTVTPAPTGVLPSRPNTTPVSLPVGSNFTSRFRLPPLGSFGGRRIPETLPRSSVFGSTAVITMVPLVWLLTRKFPNASEVALRPIKFGPDATTTLAPPTGWFRPFNTRPNTTPASSFNCTVPTSVIPFGTGVVALDCPLSNLSPANPAPVTTMLPTVVGTKGILKNPVLSL